MAAAAAAPPAEQVDTVEGPSLESATSGKRAATAPAFPFVRIAGQTDMKLALMLNVIDPRIGGVLIMGDRGTGKSIAVGKILGRHIVNSMRVQPCTSLALCA